MNQCSWRQAACQFVEHCDSKFVRMWERLLAKELFVKDVNLEINQNMSETVCVFRFSAFRLKKKIKSVSGVSRINSVFFCQCHSTNPTRLHLHANLIQKTRGRTLGTQKEQCHFGNRGTLVRNFFFFFSVSYSSCSSSFSVSFFSSSSFSSSSSSSSFSSSSSSSSFFFFFLSA